MNAGTLVFLVTVLLVIGVVAVLVARRPRRGVTLEPPKAPPVTPAPAPPPVTVEPEAPPVVVPVKPSFRDRLAKARSTFAGAFGSVLSRTSIDRETWDDLEEALLRADVGIGPTTELLDALRARVSNEGITQPAALLDALKDEMKARLTGDRSLRFEPGGPNVWLFVGVNGVGKTTTIGKVAQREIADGRSVMMAAGDTFRAAAAEQLGLWAERVGADIVRGN